MASKLRSCSKCVFWVFRQCPRFPEGGYVCFSGFSPSDHCFEFCLCNLTTRGLSISDLHKPIQLHFIDF